MLRWRACLATTATVLGTQLVLAGGAASIAASTADALVDRLAAYAEQFGREFQGVVATERYVQVIRPWRGAPPARANVTHADVAARRELHSDVLLVFEADGPWNLHRDVIAVDGEQVGDRKARLHALFVEPSLTARDRLRRMTGESARYNLGDITRTLNIPTFPLIVVHPSNRHRFRLRVRGSRQEDGVTVREVTFEERQRPTLVRSTQGRDVALRGRLLVDEATGEFIHARLDPRPEGVTSRIEVWFARVPGLRLRVPVRMWEWYQVAGVIRDPSINQGRGFHRAYIEAVAEYSAFRRYAVEVDERIAGPKE